MIRAANTRERQKRRNGNQCAKLGNQPALANVQNNIANYRQQIHSDKHKRKRSFMYSRKQTLWPTEGYRRGWHIGLWENERIALAEVCIQGGEKNTSNRMIWKRDLFFYKKEKRFWKPPYTEHETYHYRPCINLEIKMSMFIICNFSYYWNF